MSFIYAVIMMFVFPQLNTVTPADTLVQLLKFCGSDGRAGDNPIGMATVFSIPVGKLGAETFRVTLHWDLAPWLGRRVPQPTIP